MLPSSKNSLVKSGMSPAVAAATMIGCFLGGVIGIQALSYVLHRFIPSHVVDCEHAHKSEEEEEDKGQEDDIESQDLTDERPLLSRDDYESSLHQHSRPKAVSEITQRPGAPRLGFQQTRRPSLQALRSFVSNTKSRCDEGGPCFGYSNPCGNECYKGISRPNHPFKNKLQRSRSVPWRGMSNPSATTKQPQLEDVNEESSAILRESTHDYGSMAHSNGHGQKIMSTDSDGESYATMDDDHNERRKHSNHSDHAANHHHHHVASNAFLSIGLQTSIAIALHKLPEGFITFATNHANPKLGFSVFMALFIHNITEGFALALPLYLAINSRIKSMLWASILGGASQPLGAGIAVLWFKVAQSRDMAPSEGVYGVMFAITSGIMTSVALQLFSESLELTHRKALCTIFAFVGMGILGLSNALTA